MSAAEPGPVLILTAMKEELRAVLRRGENARRGPGDLFQARWGKTAVLLAATGDGESRAGLVAAAICDAARPAALLGLGIAGALSADLAAGDLLAARRIRDGSGDAPFPDERLLARALALGARAGTLVNVQRPAVGAGEKAALALSLDGAVPAAADMESAAWARAAASRGIPYLIVRAISDRAGESLPEYIARSLREDGGIRRSSVVAHALLSPSTIPALLALRRRVRECGEKLSLFLDRFLAEP